MNHYYIVIFLLCIFSTSVYAEEDRQKKYDYQQYQGEINDAEQVHDYEKRMLKVDDLYQIFPDIQNNSNQEQPEYFNGNGRIEAGTDIQTEDDAKTKAKARAAANADDTDKQAEDDAKAKAEAEAKARAAERAANKARRNKETRTGRKSTSKKEQKQDSGFYYPPSANQDFEIRNNNLKLGGEGFKQDEILFGIPIGTRIPVEVFGNASSVQPAYIQFTTLETIKGKYRDLPVHSTLFARPSAVRGSDKLYCTVVKGITPDELEFDGIRGIAHNMQLEAGLNGKIISDGKVLNRAVSSSGLALGAALTSELTGSVIGEAGKEGLDAVMSEKGDEAKANQGRAAFIVKSLPQKAYIYIEKTF